MCILGIHNWRLQATSQCRSLRYTDMLYICDKCTATKSKTIDGLWVIKK